VRSELSSWSVDYQNSGVWVSLFGSLEDRIKTVSTGKGTFEEIARDVCAIVAAKVK
jgi:hypothetical protein